MSDDRDKHLTEAMGECWYEYEGDSWGDTSCGGNSFTIRQPKINNNFSTWEGFGKLWEWAQKQEWFVDFMSTVDGTDYGREIPYCERATFWLESVLIHPDHFADSVYEYLKERE